MENKENLEAINSENVETAATEEIAGEQVEGKNPQPKTYTQEEVDEIVGKRLARNKAKITKEYSRKYGKLEDALRAGTGQESVEDITDTLTKFYEKKGIQIKREPAYSDEDIEVLARADADSTIQYGYEEVVDETDRLAKLGAENMSAREKAYFKALAEYRQNIERRNELEKIGVTDDVYNSKEFQDFAGKFISNTPISEIYNIYSKTLPNKEIKPMGSVTNKASETGTVKDFYTRDEALKFTKADFDRNPELFKAVQESMLKW